MENRKEQTQAELQELRAQAIAEVIADAREMFHRQGIGLGGYGSELTDRAYVMAAAKLGNMVEQSAYVAAIQNHDTNTVCKMTNAIILRTEKARIWCDQHGVK